jgi:LCP family protein required for cell wall assembly
MSDDEAWKGWYQQGGSADGGAGADPTASMQTPGASFTPRSGGGASGAAGGAAAGGGWPSQPPPSSAPGSAGAGSAGAGSAGAGSAGAGSAGAGSAYGGSAYGGSSYTATPYGTSTTYGGGRRWRFWGQPGRRGRRIGLIAGIVVLVLIIAMISSYFWIDGRLSKSVRLPAFAGTSAGTNWLITGSDSRKGLSRTQIDKLHVGFNFGTLNSDSIMLLHTGGPKPVLISIPRDSYVNIPGHGMNKINATLAFGGPTLLIKTVEEVTGLRIDHYMGIGFGGLVNVVNTVGGVRICLPTALKDSNSGVNLSKGCHNLNGTQALAFVRDRHSFLTSDLQRVQDQRAFLRALLSKATSPGVYLNPFTAFPFASTAAGSISVDKGTGLYDLMQVAFALRNPQTGTVPIANPALPTNAGEAVEWDQAQAQALFAALKANKAVPKGLLTGTKLG